MSTVTAHAGGLPAIKLPTATLDGAPVSPPAAARNYDAVLKLTSEIFSSDHITVTHELDPEIVGKEYLVVSVKTQGEMPDLLAKESQWHHRIWDLATETASFYCLSLDLG